MLGKKIHVFLQAFPCLGRDVENPHARAARLNVARGLLPVEFGGRHQIGSRIGLFRGSYKGRWPVLLLQGSPSGRIGDSPDGETRGL